MAIDDESDYARASLEKQEKLLGKLLEAQVTQTGLMKELVNVSKSLARSESRESVAEVLSAVSGYIQALDSTTASPTQAPPEPPARVAPPAQRPLLSDEELAVLGGYDELRAALGRTDAKNFYVTATADPTANTLIIAGEAVPKADTMTVNETPVTGHRDGNQITITDPPKEVFRTPQPIIRLSSAGRVIAVARFITVKTPSTTARLRG